MRLRLQLRRRGGDDSGWWLRGWSKGSDYGWRGLWLWLRLLEQGIGGYAWVEQQPRAADGKGGDCGKEVTVVGCSGCSGRVAATVKKGEGKSNVAAGSIVEEEGRKEG
ncbi:hypothetical protein B296_00025073 [Ensete ventricosum]|uniref:Uncharacterized protein n=1 Tax=Ensete ventricosum TaxID=4639 RepID=A0A426X6R2_ENSVE|nr:hypothetical protein B296_00025073 [Ensete ventricosum]